MSDDTLLLRAEALRGPVACVDLETTGGMAARHRVIEIGIVLLDGGRVVEQWSSLVNPGRRIPQSISDFTGISKEMVEDAPEFGALRQEIRRRLEGRLFVAHNARFDYGFLRSEFRRLEERYASPVLCTVRLSRSLFREHARHNLDTLIERYGLGCDARHRALGDARVLPQLIQAMERAAGAERLQQAVLALLSEPRLPPQLPPELDDELPEGPGVYLFRGESGTALYVGKSRNIRSRVLAHFGAADRSSKESRLARQVHHVEWIETGGEFGALLLESKLVKELAPEANRRLRGSDRLWCLRLVAEEAGLQPRVQVLAEPALPAGEEIHGPFRSERDAWRALEGKAREERLCMKTLGREEGAGSCFAYQLGRCRGACVGQEPRALHDARLRVALAGMRIKPWPFQGPIGVREPGPGGEGEVVHVLDHWRHLGTASRDDQVERILEAGGDEGFDADAYRIIRRQLEQLRPRDVRSLRRERGERRGD